MVTMSQDRATIHGTLVRVDGKGVLYIGEAGTGKSSFALKLLWAGHLLVADDVVVIERTGDVLFGSAPERLKGVIAIPDLGIFDVRDVLGNRHFTDSSRIDRCVEIVSQNGSFEHSGEMELLGIKVPMSRQDLQCEAEERVFTSTIGRKSIRKSELRFLRAHAAFVASPKQEYVTE